MEMSKNRIFAARARPENGPTTACVAEPTPLKSPAAEPTWDKKKESEERFLVCSFGEGDELSKEKT